MYTDIKTFEDACKALSLDAEKVLPDFSFYPEADQKPMIAHAKLVIICKAINEGWVPDWTNGEWDKFYAWFKMGSPSGGGFSYIGYGRWRANSVVGSRLCYQSKEKAEYAGRQFEELYREYFVIQ